MSLCWWVMEPEFVWLQNVISTYFFFLLVMPCGMGDFSSPNRDQTHAPCIGSMES